MPRCDCSGRRRTGSGRPMSWACSRWPRPVCARSRIPPARSSSTTAGRHRAASWRRRSKAAGRCSSRSRRSSARRATARPRGRRADSIPNRLSLLIAVLGRRAGIALGEPGRVRQPRRRSVRDGTGARPAARPRPRLVEPRSAIRPGRSQSARSVCSASSGRVTGLERRLREAARLGFDRAIVPAAASGAAARSSTASISSRSATFERPSSPRSATAGLLVARRSRRC